MSADNWPLYTVIMRRWGERDNHSYVLGVFLKKSEAIAARDHEREWRGGTYDGEVQEWEKFELPTMESVDTNGKIVSDVDPIHPLSGKPRDQHMLDKYLKNFHAGDEQ